MMLSARSALLAALLCHGVIGGPAVRPSPQHVLTGDHHQIESQQQAPRKLQGRFLHITDLHPDEFYKVHSSTAEGDACHRGSGPAGTYGAETSDCDTPWALINATFDYIGKHFKDQIDFVVWTGDSARHDSDEKIPRSRSQVLGSNRAVAHKFAETFADQTGHQLAVPVVATLGNNDILPHNILLPGPNKWLRYYTEIWAPFIPEEQRHSFEFGGWYYVEVIPNRLAVFSLNTLYFFDRNAAVDDCVNPAEPGFKQMEWLRVQLQFMRRRGMKAMLMGHVPPARTDSKQLWDESCWQKYTLWLNQFRDVVVAGLYGHMNVDHFMLQDAKDINYDILGAGENAAAAEDVFVRESMEDELSVASTADYLQELRENWAKLPKPQTMSEQEVEGEEEGGPDMEGQGGKKHRKNKGKGGNKDRKGGRWGERYQLTLVGPSIVPNYLPTLRVYEYNISGLEDVPVWADVQRSAPAPVPAAAAEPEDAEGMVIELRGAPAGAENQKKGGRKKGKGKKPKKPKDPNLVVPEPPSAHTPPGPAYSAQPLTLTGFTQYFANLTHINNDMTADDNGDDVDESRWRRGKHGDRDPQRKPARPREFAYEVEYSTFDDALYNLTDLTVGSYAELAWRMGRDARLGKDAQGFEGEDGDDSEDEVEEAEADGDDDDDDDDDENEVEADGKKHKKKGKKHGRKKHNKVWLHFLSHAFVKTVERKDLKKLDH
ncbi:uncharacterized protein E0L32_007841 [Thyridium curvatum]|uniref:Endopolyphosphatase n=1 Tax=Thyridium curvatum TaxID=1093900 RepID=A0A507AND4_9PEZI|nr:uncharacterized protein E0L32_007841 [Thyridium curvatum]TPX11422.1 hypothetical protein E0L32_007841 [Thyridium curvatum]